MNKSESKMCQSAKKRKLKRKIKKWGKKRKLDVQDGKKVFFQGRKFRREENLMNRQESKNTQGKRDKQKNLKI